MAPRTQLYVALPPHQLPGSQISVVRSLQIIRRSLSPALIPRAVRVALCEARMCPLPVLLMTLPHSHCCEFTDASCAKGNFTYGCFEFMCCRISFGLQTELHLGNGQASFPGTQNCIVLPDRPPTNPQQVKN